MAPPRKPRQNRGVGNARLAERVQSGERAAFAEMYAEYADRIYRFCVVLLRDRDEAGDAMHDTFVLAAQRIGQLRDPERLEPWLFAIARHLCYRGLQERGRVKLVDVAPDEVVLDEDPARGLSAAEASALVWEAASGLNERDRAILSLSTNEGLEGADLAAALGEQHANPYSLVHRAKQQLERAVAVLLVARFGRRECRSLDEMLYGWDGALTPLLRKRVARHVERCASCQRTRSRALALAVFSAVPLVRPQRLEAMPRSPTPNELCDIAARRPATPERWQPDGFPPFAHRNRRHRRFAVVLVAAAFVLFALAIAEVSVATGSPGHRHIDHASTSPRARASRGRNGDSRVLAAHKTSTSTTRPVTTTLAHPVSVTTTTAPARAIVPTPPRTEPTPTTRHEPTPTTARHPTTTTAPKVTTTTFKF
jgi:RNA polymerase sigma factor (sigma-70 family)